MAAKRRAKYIVARHIILVVVVETRGVGGLVFHTDSRSSSFWKYTTPTLSILQQILLPMADDAHSPNCFLPQAYVLLLRACKDFAYPPTCLSPLFIVHYVPLFIQHALPRNVCTDYYHTLLINRSPLTPLPSPSFPLLSCRISYGACIHLRIMAIYLWYAYDGDSCTWLLQLRLRGCYYTIVGTLVVAPVLAIAQSCILYLFGRCSKLCTLK